METVNQQNITRSESDEKNSLKRIATAATMVAALGASLGVSVGELMAADAKVEARQIKLDRGAEGRLLKGGDGMIIIIGGKPYIRSAAGKQVPAQDKIYVLENGSKVTVKGGQIVESR